MTFEPTWHDLEHEPRRAAGYELSDLLAHLPDWAEHLPPDGRDCFAAALTDAVQTAAQLDLWADFGHLISGWRATAESYADPGFMAARAEVGRQDRDETVTTVSWSQFQCGSTALELASLLLATEDRCS